MLTENEAIKLIGGFLKEVHAVRNEPLWFDLLDTTAGGKSFTLMHLLGLSKGEYVSLLLSADLAKCGKESDSIMLSICFSGFIYFLLDIEGCGDQLPILGSKKSPLVCVLLVCLVADMGCNTS